MRNSQKGRATRRKILSVIWGIFVAVCIVLYVIDYINELEYSDPIETQSSTIGISNPDGTLMMYMIDSKQADSFLFVRNGKAALIDTGTRGSGDDVVKYIQNLGITELEFVVGTHPHDDHMGGMYDVLTGVKVKQVIYPETKAGLVTTNWYMQFLSEVKNQSIETVHPTVGDTFYLDDVVFKVVGPISYDGDNLNNYSIVMKVTFGEMDILMTGDSEKEMERDLLASNQDIDVEILKVGHHGSETSTSLGLLDATTPDYALISCKVGNKYNHPVKETMDNLEERNIIVYRTDECGNVVITITPTTIEFDVEPGDYLSGPELEVANEN